MRNIPPPLSVGCACFSYVVRSIGLPTTGEKRGADVTLLLSEGKNRRRHRAEEGT